jgi:ABC-type multidrug transport system fused ATPase/permease subunit
MNRRTIDAVPDLVGHSAAPQVGSDRAFGCVFGAVFMLVGLYPLILGGHPRFWALILALLLFLIAVVRPRLLSRANRLWAALGQALGRIISPVALLLAYILAIVPTGLLLRAFGKDPLRLRIDPEAKSYWLPRTPPGRADSQMTRQF